MPPKSSTKKPAEMMAKQAKWEQELQGSCDNMNREVEQKGRCAKSARRRSVSTKLRRTGGLRQRPRRLCRRKKDENVNMRRPRHRW